MIASVGRAIVLIGKVLTMFITLPGILIMLFAVWGELTSINK